MSNLHKKALIVEDDEFSAIILKGLLETIGFHISGVAPNASKAIALFEQENPDLIFVDIGLEGAVDGVQLVAELKTKTDAPIFYVTSETREEVIDAAKKTLPAGFVAKPFDLEQLKVTIEVAIEYHELTRTKINQLVERGNMAEIQIKELEETNSHLISATWRERELKSQLQDSLDELQKSKAIIEEQNKKITDSINYAKQIQNSIIPSIQNIRTFLPQSFMFYKPKDVVSGDFPYFYKQDDWVYFAAVDCTGHGVPGAMMSLIGHLLLNDTLHNNVAPTPSEVLLNLHQKVVKTLKQDAEDSTSKDGMDVAICRINIKTNQVEFSGAHRPLYHVTGDELIQYKGDKFGIGGMQGGRTVEFTNHEITITPGDALYYFSDGLPDQFGGPDKLKFGPKRIREIAQSVHSESINAIEETFANAFNSWLGDQKQIDDVLLIGIKF